MPKPKPEKVRGGATGEKIPCNWRILKSVVDNLKDESRKQGYGSIPAFLNVHFTEYFKEKGR